MSEKSKARPVAVLGVAAAGTHRPRTPLPREHLDAPQSSDARPAVRRHVWPAADAADAMQRAVAQKDFKVATQ